jgi:hypothetical protein
VDGHITQGAQHVTRQAELIERVKSRGEGDGLVVSGPERLTRDPALRLGAKTNVEFRNGGLRFQIEPPNEHIVSQS